MSQLIPAEGIPNTQVFQSFNGKIYVAGYPIIRISRATFTISNMVDIYYEVGRREGIPYAREFDVRGSFTRAYVNGAEWKMAIGLEPKKYDFEPGKTYGTVNSGALESLLDNLDGYDNSLETYNTYPIKTDISMDVNSVDSIIMNRGADIGGYKIVADFFGVMIDAATIVLGGPGDIIISGPINWIGESAQFRAESLATATATPAGPPGLV